MRASVAKITLTVDIAAPPDRVGVFFVPQRMPYWYGAEMPAELIVLGRPPDFAAGQKVQIRGTLGQRAVSLTAVVTEYAFARTLEWRFQDEYGVRGLQRWEIEKVGDDSRVRLHDEYELPGAFGRIFDWLVTRHAVAHRDLEDLARLKRLAENREHTSADRVRAAHSG